MPAVRLRGKKRKVRASIRALSACRILVVDGDPGAWDCWSTRLWSWPRRWQAMSIPASHLTYLLFSTVYLALLCSFLGSPQATVALTKPWSSAEGKSPPASCVRTLPVCTPCYRTGSWDLSVFKLSAQEQQKWNICMTGNTQLGNIGAPEWKCCLCLSCFRVRILVVSGRSTVSVSKGWVFLWPKFIRNSNHGCFKKIYLGFDG